MELKRCQWPGQDPLYLAYHDEEWGVPLHEDNRLFEMIVLEGMQSGLSWITILRKREAFRVAFHGFDPRRVATFGPKKIEKLLLNPGIIRNRLKISSTISNARAFLEVQREFGSFDAYIWQFTGGKTLQHALRGSKDLAPRSAESDAMSKALKKRGFRFVGSTICYAFIQATGMVNDHLRTCFRWVQLR